MRMRAQSTFLLVLILSFVFVDVSESISFAPAVGLLIRSRLVSSFVKRIVANFSSIWNRFKSLFKNTRLKIGETAKGLSDLKDYLEIFGYIIPPLNSNFTDEFTEHLQSALTQFQKNFNLEITGQMDEDVYDIMSQPRCGVPDIVNGTNTMNSSNTTSFEFEPWWRTGQKELKYAFHPQNNVTVGVKSLFRDAFNRWSNVTALGFTETASFNGSDIRIAFVTLDGRGGTVGGAYGNYSTHVGGIYLDSEEEWVLPGEEVTEDGDVDLESVVMHEVGHVLGLGHSSVKEAVMYPIVLPEKKTELENEDDLKRIRQIYGVN